MGQNQGCCTGMRPRLLGAAEGVGERLLPLHLTSGVRGQGGEPGMTPGRQPGQPGTLRDQAEHSSGSHSLGPRGG